MTRINPARTFESWCVYTHATDNLRTSDNQPELQIMYVGMCRLSQLIDATDARKNSEWRRTVQTRDSVDLTICAITEDLHQAANLRAVLIKQHQPWCNVHGYEVAGAGRIECIETGEIFESAAAACRQFNIAPPAMSNHMRNVAGYKRLKGKTFRRV